MSTPNQPPQPPYGQHLPPQPTAPPATPPQPPAPPATPPQFGQGQQVPQQMPYGAPAPAYPPQYGQQQMPQQQPPAPAQKKKGRGCLITALVLLVLLTAGAGTGAWFLLGLGRGQTLWSLPYSGGNTDRQNYLSTWFTDKSVVRAQQDGISALDPGTGQRLWGTPVPGEGTVICASSSVSSQDIAVLAYGKTGSCTTVFAVDLATGRKLWELPVGKADEPPSFAVSGQAVVVNDKAAYGLRDGSKAWSAKSLRTQDGCTSGTFTGGEKLVRSVGCASEKDAFGDPVRTRYTISEIDPATGKALWTSPLEGEDSRPGYAEPHGVVLSTSPIVVRESELGYRVLSDDGELRGLVSLKGENYLGGDLAFRGGNPSPSLAAEGDTLVVEQNRSRKGESVDGFDMDSGDRLWSTGPATDVRYDLVQGADGLTAVKYDNDTFDLENHNPFSLVTFDPASGEQDEVQDFDGVGETLGVFKMPYLHDGRLFLASVSNRGSVGALEDATRYDHHDSSLVAFQP